MIVSADMDLFFSHLFIIKKLQRDAFRKYAKFLNGRLLDIGCGNSPYRKLISCQSYMGIDGLPDVKPDVAARCESIPCKEKRFDAVICTELLEHLPEPEKALKEIKRVLKEGGYLYLTVPQSWCLHYEPDDYFRFTKYGIKYLLEKNGFEIRAVERIGGLFSMIGQRLMDLFWQLMVNCLSVICTLKWSERIASSLTFPGSVLFYCAAKLGDEIDKKDALGWSILARIKKDN